ncbi:MAG: HlyD family type I secretion periplasmic adaptor subunit [Hellea sp.]|nr:HlyD family type I secretion periplasmic adaptor subunit [Hellea sp.]
MSNPNSSRQLAVPYVPDGPAPDYQTIGVINPGAPQVDPILPSNPQDHSQIQGVRQSLGEVQSPSQISGGNVAGGQQQTNFRQQFAQQASNNQPWQAEPVHQEMVHQDPTALEQQPQTDGWSNKSEDVVPVRHLKTKKRKKIKHLRSTADLSFQSLSSYLKLGYIFVAVLVLAVGGWAYFAKIEGAVIVSGKIAVEGEPKTVQHLDGGIISDIFVTQGDVVEKGQPLLVLDSTILSANVTAAEIKYFENEALIARLNAERAGRFQIDWPITLRQARSNPRVKAAMDGQSQLFQARQEAAYGHVQQIESNIDKLKIEEKGLVSERSFTLSEYNLVRTEHEKYSRLLEQGLVSRSRIVDLQRDMTSLENRLAKIESQRQNIVASIFQQEDEITQFNRRRQEEILTEFRDAQTRAGSFEESLKTSLTKKNSVQLFAPVSGTVHDLTVTTIGGVISSGQPILQIVPQNENLIISGQMSPDDIDQVFVGQSARVVFSTLDQNKTLEVVGIVEFVSANVLANETTGEPYFDLNVAIPDSELPKLQGVALTPGMPVSIFVQTNERTVMNYLFSPIRNALSYTMKDGQ